MNCGLPTCAKATPARSFQVGGELKKVKLARYQSRIRPYMMKAWSGLAPGRPRTSFARDGFRPLFLHNGTQWTGAYGKAQATHDHLSAWL